MWYCNLVTSDLAPFFEQPAVSDLCQPASEKTVGWGWRQWEYFSKWFHVIATSGKLLRLELDVHWMASNLA